MMHLIVFYLLLLAIVFELNFIMLKLKIVAILCIILNGCNHKIPLYQAESFKNWQILQKENIVMQERDYSCGAAALATLLNYYFDDNVHEEDLLTDILKRLPEEERATRRDGGLSLLDLKQAVERLGYQAAGIKLPFSTLLHLKGPVLVYLETNTFKHFAVLKGVREDRVYLADPSRGNLRISINVFANEWQGIALAVVKPGSKLSNNHKLSIKEDIPIRHELRAARRSLRY